MMTFMLDNDQVLRVRQRKLLGPATVELLGPVRDAFGHRRTERTITVPADRMKKLIVGLLEEGSDNNAPD